jgi:hypothetical protein
VKRRHKKGRWDGTGNRRLVAEHRGIAVPVRRHHRADRQALRHAAVEAVILQHPERAGRILESVVFDLIVAGY